MKTLLFLTSMAMCIGVHAQDTLEYTMCVASYDYTCHTTDKDGNATDVCYRIALQVGQKVACSMGYATHADSLKREKLDEVKHNVPRCYYNYPEGMMTAHEVMPFDRFITTEKMNGTKWQLNNETDTILHLVCQKATGEYHGRTWTVWFAPDIPSTAGPWRLHGLPGLIMKAEAEGVHKFECFDIDFVKEPIVLQHYNGIKAPHSKFVKHRNKKMCGNIDANRLIPLSLIDNVTVMAGSVLVNGIMMPDTSSKYLPLELK